MKLHKTARQIFHSFYESAPFQKLTNLLQNNVLDGIRLSGIAGSGFGVTGAGTIHTINNTTLFIAPDQEAANYLYNDLESLLGETDMEANQKRVLYFPASYRKDYAPLVPDSRHMLLRAEVLRSLSHKKKICIVTYPEALTEKSVRTDFIRKNALHLHRSEAVSTDFIEEVLSAYGFSRVDFVVDPGQYAIRGGICDIYSFADENPYRISFLGDTVESIRSFDPGNQLTISGIDQIDILPDLNSSNDEEEYESLISLIPEDSIIWLDDMAVVEEKCNTEYTRIIAHEEAIQWKYSSAGDIIKSVQKHVFVCQRGNASEEIDFNQNPQSSFNRNFELLTDDIFEKASLNWNISIVSESPKQIQRLHSIFQDLETKHRRDILKLIRIEKFSVSAGFTDKKSKTAVYTDHQIFSRHLKARISQRFTRPERITLNELINLQPGDYVVHINHGVGQFGGLVKTEVNGEMQEAIRLLYKGNDELMLSIHSLHRISKYVGKDGSPPKIDVLGSKTWETKKNRAKKQVKDIARDLIQLYAKRKSSKGFAFMPDTYLQHELEASFIYEDTPDQEQATLKIKEDMEAEHPMDRLICGDVGFGKTEIAIRAAFKAVADSKQVAILVPTTILALQHYRTFRERLGELPANVDYLNRFRSTKQQKESLQKLKSGELDIIIGTHKLLGKDIEFADLGLLIIDEEQKFGVAAKEKLRNIKANVDTLTLTATPIPRTLQFSLMGARDLSILKTPPANRFPVETEVRPFHPDLIKEAIENELSRSGQVYFVHNRIQNIGDVAEMIRKLVPAARMAVGHGQMDGKELEQKMMRFIDGEVDVLISTSIVENGLDVPNANTMIINDAQNYGLSDLHQLRGRVGRSNKKAFCYLMTPPSAVLSDDARKRLRAISEFSDLGSGFQIAMRDLDIRGAGNLLGAEQSGFISEIGYEMYQKILDEAMQELKQEEFADLYEDDNHKKVYVRDVSIETDISLLFPDYYMPGIAERLMLYKELNDIQDEEGLSNFEAMLKDRFGELPEESKNLLAALRLKWLAKNSAIEKVVLKNNSLILYFSSNQESPFFAGDGFQNLLQFVAHHPDKCMMKEKNERLLLRADNINGIEDAIGFMNEMTVFSM
ncbi:MAG: transcription-repair coupling factor [Marinilabiliales bacterium]|nr:MAG: transcription-repair coupling factor [Marinilabiliales bacterium]